MRAIEWMRRGAMAGALLLCSGCGPSDTPPRRASDPVSLASHGASLVRWTDYYIDLAPDDRPALPGSPSDPPTIRKKYDRRIVAGGLTELAEASLERIRTGLPPAEARALARTRLKVRNCVGASGPVLLASAPAGSTEICVAPLLVSAIFFDSLGFPDDPQILRFHRQLTDWGIDPGSVTSEYDRSRLQRHGITEADWRAVLGAYEAEWLKLQGSLDFLAAYLVECGILGRAPDQCGTDAAALAARGSGRLDADALRGAVKRAIESYPRADWGLLSAGDGEDALGAFIRATGP